MIKIFNVKTENFSGPNVYRLTRPHVLSNPYTHLPLDKTQARYCVKDRETAIDCYDHYFDVMYNGDTAFKQAFDEIYEKYKNGEDVYLGCVCSPLPCHCDILEKKLIAKLVKENFKNFLKKDEQA